MIEQAPAGRILTGRVVSTRGRSRLMRYSFTVAVVVLGWLAREALSSAVGPTALPFIFFFPAVALAGWYGGLGPGLLASLLSAAAAEWFFNDPVNAFLIHTVGDIAALAAFVVSCLFIVGAAEAMHRAKALTVTEVAERRRAEELLWQRTAQFETLVNQAPLGVYLVDAGFRIRQVNPIALPVFGDIPDLIGRDFDEVMHILWSKEFADEVVRHFRHTLETGESQITPEWIELRRDRDLIECYEWRIDRIPLPDRQHGVVCYFRDISQQVAAREALRESEARLHGIIASATDAVISVDGQQRIVLFNPAAEEIFGLKEAEALGQSIDRLIPERFRAPDVDYIAAFAQTNLSHVAIGTPDAVCGLRANREEFPIEASVSRTEVGGEPLFTIILRDITERRKTVERLAQFAAIVEYTRDAVISKSLDGIVTSWNPGAEALFGYGAADMIGQPMLRIIPPELHAEEEMILTNLRAGHIVRRETVRLTRAGRRVPVSLTISPIKDAAGNVIGACKIARDITEQKADRANLHRTQRKLLLHAADLEARVSERTSELQQTVNELQHFSYSIAHDMRAPLRAMGTFAQLLLEENPDLPAESGDYARRIVTGARRLDGLIRDALNYTRSALQNYPFQSINLSDLVQGLIDTYPNLDAADADIRIEGKLPAVLGNESLLTQCFANLLGNGVKFVATGTRPELCVWAETDTEVARIWIQDNGIGIPANSQRRLFGLFQKLDSQYDGTGIGLAIVRQAVERMAGRVGVESEPGRGSRFWVELPLAPTEHRSA